MSNLFRHVGLQAADFAAVPPAARRPPGRPAGGSPVVDREQLLDAAERVIAREGNGASLDDIAAEAGVTKPIVYARVGSRAQLSNALSERLADRLMAEVAAKGVATLDRAGLSTVFRTVLETLDAHRELFLYVTRGSADDAPDRTLYLAGRNAEPLAAMLAQWRAGNGRDPSVAQAWAYGIVGMLNLVALWWMQGSEFGADVVGDQLAELVWCGLDG